MGGCVLHKGKIQSLVGLQQERADSGTSTYGWRRKHDQVVQATFKSRQKRGGCLYVYAGDCAMCLSKRESAASKTSAVLTAAKLRPGV